jgi:two-component system NtrC family sensor kinase
MKQHYSALTAVRFLCWLLLSLLAGQSLPAQPLAPSTASRPPLADTSRVRQLQAQADSLPPSSPQALAVQQQALLLAQRLHDTRGQAAANLRLSIVYRFQAQFELGRHAAQQAQQLAARLGNRSQQAQSYMQLSRLDLMQGNYAPAIAAALRGLPLAEQAGDQQTLGRLQGTLSTIYVQLEDYPTAIPLLHASLKSARQAHDMAVVLASLIDLGVAHDAQKNFPAALRYFQQAREVAHQLHNERSESEQEQNMALVYWEQGRYPLARATAWRGYARALAGLPVYNLPMIQFTLAQVYAKLGQPDSALAFARPSFAQARREGDKIILRNVSDLLATLYAQRGEYAAAYRYQGLAGAYRDTLAGEATQRKTTALRYGYELNKKQSQIALLTKSRQLQAQQSARQRQQLYLLLAGLVGVAVAAGLFWRNAQLRQRANRRLGEKNAEIARQRDALDQTLLTLQATQRQLIQKEKMASLGELTAGIAHEIQNPLNFVNNFSEVSAELMLELEEAQAAGDATEVSALATDVRQNLTKITEHGQRAAGIVRGMLEHSRPSTGERASVEVNALCEEYLRLAYQGVRAKDNSFTAELQTAFAPNLPLVEGVGADLGRVLVNLFNNAFYAVQQRVGEAGYVPTVRVQTRQLGPQLQIQVQDNGIGMSPEVQAKVFQPFFTTKPAGEGTGLGLSLSYDIITQGHGGALTVESQPGQGSTFTVSLPVLVAELQGAL